MLRFIVGAAHSGKTGLLRSRIAEIARRGGRAVLIVPEQASFSNEKALSEALGPDVSAARVVSFTRLAELLLRELGGGGRLLMDETAACLLMSVALEELRDELTVYRRHYRSRGFVEQMVALASECKNAGVTPSVLFRFSSEQPAGGLREKTNELSLILDAFDAVASQSYVSEADMLTLAAERLADTGHFSRTEIFIDDFGGFTAPELRLIEELLAQSPRVTVSMCCDALDSREPAFALAVDTAGRLKRAAGRAGVPIETEHLPQRARVPAGLAAMERAARREVLPGEAPRDGSVVAHAAPDPHAELEFVAASMARLAREAGLRWREMAVIARDLGRYRTLLPSVFGRYGVPFFLDARADAKSSALAAGLLLAVSAAARTGGRLCELARSPLLGLEAREAGELDNYCYVWSVADSRWDRPFTGHPDGIVAGMSDAAAARLARIDAARERVAGPILRLRESMRRATGRAFARGVAAWLEEVAAASRLAAFSRDMPSLEREEFLDQQSLLWERLMEILDLFHQLPDSLRLEPARAAELFELALGSVKVATPPRTLDEVAVGTAERMRADAPRAVFLLGAVEGEFPAAPDLGGLLSDGERRRMAESGLELLVEGERHAAQERMYCYRAVTAPSERLVVSLPWAEPSGEALTPSLLHAWAQALSGPPGGEELPEVQTPGSAAAALAARAGENTAQAATLRRLCEDCLGREPAGRIAAAVHKRPHRLANREVARRLFGERLRLSPSKLENYYSCPFSYFVRSGLRALPRRRAELSPLEAGTLIHRVLERMVSRHGGRGLTALEPAAVRAEVKIEIGSYLAERLDDPDALPRRTLHAFDRVGDWLVELLLRLGEEFAQSAFEPAAFELPIREGEAVAPMALRTADGREVLVEGTVDRVDVAVVKGERYVRVVDYKSGGKAFRLSDVYYGLNMQMLIYLFAVCQNGGGDWKGVLPAGILYLPAMGKYHSVARDDGEGLENARKKQYRMNGLLLSDPEVLAAMEADGAGVFIPVKAGRPASDALASLSELGRLRRLVETRVSGMAEALGEGEIAARPIESGGERPCRFCDYRGICGFEEGDAVRQAAVLARAELLGEEEDRG